MSDRRGGLVAKNVDGTLERLKTSNEKGRYIGSRKLPNGMEETMRFNASDRDEAIGRWLKWQRDGIAQHVTRTKAAQSRATLKNAENKEKKEMATSTKPAKVEFVYVLRYVNGRNSKDIAAYLLEDAALNMAIDLKSALELADVDGEYAVEKVPLR